MTKLLRDLDLLLISTIIFALSSPIFSQNINNTETESWETSKKGGVIFRVTGGHPMEEYLNYASLFSAKNQNFSFTIGLGTSIVGTEGYAEGIKFLQNQGNELLDPTPNYRTNYFYTIFDPQIYDELDGIDHIIGSKICLQFESIDPSKKIKEGYVDILDDRVYGEQEFDEVKFGNVFMYFPSLDTLIMIGEMLDNDLYSISDVWNEPINLGTHYQVNYYLFSVNDVSVTDDALKLLGSESIKLAEYYDLKRPYSWIQPGGNYPYMTPLKVKAVMGNELGYLSGEVYTHTAFMTYNEYDPTGDRKFAMLWGKFREEKWTVEESKEVIADLVAKHRVAIGENYFSKSSDYLSNTAALLDWCIEKNIPIATHSQWANILYNTVQDPYVNIYPSLNTDLDENGYPDGYTLDNPNFAGILDTTDGAPTDNDYSMFVTSQTGISYIEGLGGLEKGENDFEIYTKGAPGNFITVTFKLGNEYETYKFPAEDTTWVKYTLNQSINGNTSLFIPDSISVINIAIYCSDYTSGKVKISGISLKSAQIDETSPSTPESVQAIGLDDRAEILWEPSNDNDIKSYLVYKSLDAQFNPDTVSSSVYTTLDTFYVDTDVIAGETYFYKISAVDFAGNKSGYSPTVSAYITTDVETSEIMPKKYELYQNFPNPFNPTTNISFALPTRSNVRLTIYNSIGQVVTELVNSEMSAGYHTVQFDGNNFSSGLYFYRINAGNFVETRKMMLIK